MAKLAQYSLYYDKHNDMFAGLDFADRQKHLGALLAQDDSMSFTIGEKTYGHTVYHHSQNDGLIVMKLANIKDILVEQNFIPVHLQHNPSCYVFIDNRDGCRRVAIQKLQTSFSSTDQVARILQKVIGDQLMKDHNYTIQLSAQRYTEDFYRMWTVKQHHTTGIRFNMSRRNADRISIASDSQTEDDTLMGRILEMEEELERENYKQVVELSPREDNAVMYVDESSRYIRNLVRYCASRGCMITLLTNDGGSFDCYVNSDTESTDKIVTSEFDSSRIDLLFLERDEDGNEITPEQKAGAEAYLLEVMNTMKCQMDARESEGEVCA